MPLAQPGDTLDVMRRELTGRKQESVPYQAYLQHLQHLEHPWIGTHPGCSLRLATTVPAGTGRYPQGRDVVPIRPMPYFATGWGWLSIVEALQTSTTTQVQSSAYASCRCARLCAVVGHVG